MQVESLKRYFLYNNSDIVTILKEMYKTDVNKAQYFAVKKK